MHHTSYEQNFFSSMKSLFEKEMIFLHNLCTKTWNSGSIWQPVVVLNLMVIELLAKKPCDSHHFSKQQQTFLASLINRSGEPVLLLY